MSRLTEIKFIIENRWHNLLVFPKHDCRYLRFHLDMAERGEAWSVVNRLGINSTIETIMTARPNSTRVQAPELRLPVPEAPGNRNYDNTSIKLTRGVLDAAKKKKSIFRPKITLSVGTWNVRTIMDDYAVKLLVHELSRYRCNIVGIAETHRLGTEELEEGGYKIVTSGKEEGEPQKRRGTCAQQDCTEGADWLRSNIRTHHNGQVSSIHRGVDHNPNICTNGRLQRQRPQRFLWLITGGDVNDTCQSMRSVDGWFQCQGWRFRECSNWRAGQVRIPIK